MSGVIFDGEMPSSGDHSEIPKSPFSRIIQFLELDVTGKSVQSVVRIMLPTLHFITTPKARLLTSLLDNALLRQELQLCESPLDKTS